MKRNLFIWLLWLLSISVTSQYYYYHGEKVPLIINTDSVVLYTVGHSRALDDNSILSTTIARNEINQYSLNRNATITSVEYIIGDSITRKMSNYFYVKLHDTADTILLNELATETRTHILGEVPYMENWYKIMVAHSTIDNTLEMSNYFYETGLFADVDPGFIFNFKSNCVSDASFHSQWGLPMINACEAWAYSKGNRSIRVAIVDEGVDVSHPEFSGVSFIHPYDCYMNQEVLSTYGAHGTFVAGILAANHNSYQIAGVAPNITIIPISHNQDIRTTLNMGENLASGISYAVSHGADIINCSWGDKGGRHYDSIHSVLLEDALSQALTQGRNGKGCIVVFASGNGGESGLRIDYPGRIIPDFLVVGSARSDGQRAYHTSYRGDNLDVLAPGKDIMSTILNNQYETHFGTSLAAPHVSGIAALILSINPDLTQKEVVNIIESTTQKVGILRYAPTEDRPNGTWNEEMGYGLVDAYASVLAAQPKYIQNQTYLSGQEVYEYATEITAGYAVTNAKPYGNVVFEAGSDVTLRGMDKVVLKSGFHAKAGSKLHIKVDQPSTTPSTSAPQHVAARALVTPTNETDDNTNNNNSLKNVESEAIVSTSIYTISGQLIQTFSGGLPNVAHLPNGMYILQHHMGNGSVKNKKIANTN